MLFLVKNDQTKAVTYYSVILNKIKLTIIITIIITNTIINININIYIDCQLDYNHLNYMMFGVCVCVRVCACDLMA